MIKTFYISGRQPRGGVLQTVLRTLVLVAASIFALFVFAASAAFAFFVIIGVLVLGLVTFSVLWLRAKLLGRPLMPNAKMWSYEAFATMQETAGRQDDMKSDGPILDARQTPDGWSVETD
ncbi:MAG TPA: hypothetical protein ENK01_01950 [Hellea balneolensis]|uniref:Uncharacterized protein n=1 Tax=Hellea balneolensis TaxID=287478 RepID=A0A7V5NWR2_9PROT|nr:hypothetical protein [Hellea balneolensis]